MKQRIFTLVMLLALVIMAGSAFAQGTYDKPYPGSSYNYNVSGMQFASDGGNFTIASTMTNVTFSNVMGVPGVYTLGTAVPVANGTLFALTFNVAYATNATDGTITVSATNITGNCTNIIFLTVDVQPLPTFAIAIAADKTDLCQTLDAAALSNVAQSVGQTTTVVFTVNPTITNVGTSSNDDGTFTYTIDLRNGIPALGSVGIPYAVAYTSGGHTCTPSVSAPFTVTGNIVDGGDPTNDVFTVSFATTTGTTGPTTIPGNITVASMTLTNGGGNYADADGSTQAVIVKSMPSIGTFN